MKKFILAGSLLLMANYLFAQTNFNAVIKSATQNNSLGGTSVLVKDIRQSFIADSTGTIAIKNIPSGKHWFVFSYVGHQQKSQAFIFPLAADITIEILLEAIEDHNEEVIVTSTRTSRTIANTPTRVETIGGEELDEKNSMRPSNVSMLLHESTGLQVQQTSAVSGNASIRVQGLDGPNTQLLKDGYPNFGNLVSGLSILEIPPLDLKQVEIIKGPASTLYRGDAIAGVVNFISKTPKEKPENISFSINPMWGKQMPACLQRTKKERWVILF